MTERPTDAPTPKEVRPASMRAAWPDPTPEMLNDPCFNAIWEVIKTWDINVPGLYAGYCGATGNHARAILDAIPGARTDQKRRAE